MDFSKSAENVLSCSTTGKFSSNSWPMLRGNSPWENLDEEGEALYNEALHHFADKLQGDKAKLQARLDEWVPKRGAYTNCRGRYLKVSHKPKDSNGIYALKFNADMTFLVVGYENGNIEMIDLMNECGVPTKMVVGSNHAPTSIVFNPKKSECFYISSTGGAVFMCNVERPEFDSWKMNKIITEGNNETYGLAINTTGERLITGGKDARIRVYDLETNDMVTCYKGFAIECKDSYTRLLEEDEEEGHYLNIYSVVCHPDNPWVFASAGLDSNIKIWDLRVKQFAVKNIFGPHIMGDAIDLKENKVLSGQWASTDGLQIWDCGSCRLLKTFKPTNLCPQSFGQYFYCAKFMDHSAGSNGDDLVMAGGSGLGGLIVGSFNENLILALYEDEGSILCADYKGDILAYGGTNHIVYLSQFLQSTVEAPSVSEYSSAEFIESNGAETL